ncbi:protein kinase domain containing protein [Stylonychia lemnae]|uniref:Protein kinase domain containing protein n=1 Tax=Stylonychia lemnae TaxID=5949 RepID=A0A078ACB5_STYLE|nr:protein kinase domain containing protein [Stylonychia lemnae]|eukprot:CDW79237.1 protein kinase domain containing protein [Stylonychia lemnae]
MEYIDGGELLDRLISVKQLSEKIVAQITKQILSAINYAKSLGVQHLDLKPENLLLDRSQKYAKVKKGSAYYLPPELLKRQIHKNSDVWACGVILHILLSGYPPFCGRDEYEILQRVKSGSYSLKAVEWKNITKEGKKLIEKILVVDPNHRYTVQQCMKDKWFELQEQQHGIGRIITVDCINNLRSFCSEQKLQSAVVNYLANKEQNLAMNKELQKIFEQFDVNMDGILSHEELIMGYQKMLGCSRRAQVQVDFILTKIGAKPKSEIDYHEFLKANIKLEHEVTDSKLRAAFNLFDIDGNGSITLDEIQYLLGGQEDVEDQVWIDLVMTADQDGDGEITFEEFKKMMYVMYLNKEIR